MGKYTDANAPCKKCGTFPANHSWVEPTRNANESEKDFQGRRNVAQQDRGAAHSPFVCDGYEDSAPPKVNATPGFTPPSGGSSFTPDGTLVRRDNETDADFQARRDVVGNRNTTRDNR